MVTQSSYPTVNHPNRVAKGGALLGGTRYRIPGLLKWSLLWSLQQCLADVCSQQPDRQRCMGGEGWTAKVISGALLGQLYLLGSSGKHLWCGQKKVSTLCLSRWIRVSGYDCRAYFHMAQTHSRPPATGIVTDKKDCPEESKVWVIQEKRYLLECCRSSTASWARGGIVTLLCTLWPHLKHCVQVWVSQYKKDIKQLEPVQRRAMKVVKDMKGKACEEQLRSFVLLSPEQRKLRVSSHYQCSSSFPCCPIFRSQKKTNAIYISSALGCFCTFQYEPPTVYQVFDIPAHVCQTVTSPGFWRDTSLSESTQRKLLGWEHCEPTAFNYSAISHAQTALIIQALCGWGWEFSFGICPAQQNDRSECLFHMVCSWMPFWRLLDSG